MDDFKPMPVKNELKQPAKSGDSFSQRFLFLVFYGLLSLAVAFFTVEFAGRLIFDRYPTGYRPDRFIMRDPVYGWSHRPNARGTWYRYMDGTKTFVEINSLGFSDREFPADKHGQRRVAIIGDSTGEAWEVPPPSRFLEILRNRLGPDPVQFLNFSVRGYGPDQALMLLKNQVVDYDPDEIIYSFCVNDLNDICRHAGKPYYLIKNDSLVLKNCPVQKRGPGWSQFDFRAPAVYFRHHSWLYEIFYDRVYLLRRVMSAWTGLINRLWPPPAAKDEAVTEDQSWLIFERILAEMKKTADQHKASLFILGNATKEMFTSEGNDFKRYQKVKTLAEKSGIVFIDVYGKIIQNKRISGAGLFHADDNLHYNKEGNQVLADILYDHLKEEPVLQ